jgi:HK97 family phage major capsid protein
MIDNPRRLLSAFGSTAWAIQESKLEEICAFLELRAAGGSLSADEVRALTSSSRNGKVQSRGGVVVIPVTGSITQRANMLTEYSGGTSTEKLGAQIDAALNSQDVRAIVLDVDSPGGNVSGVPELAEKIYAARGQKKIVAVVNSLMASAAYWIGSSADEIVITPSGMIGSIGVLWVHTEFSEMDAAMGIRNTIIRAGLHKAEANSMEPLPDGARERMQTMVDDYYDQFVAAVARNRRTTPDAVRKGYGQGDVLTAKRAVGAGLADRVATLEQVLSELGVEPNALAEARAKAATEEARKLAAAIPESRSIEIAAEIEARGIVAERAVLPVPVVTLGASDYIDDEDDPDAADMPDNEPDPLNDDEQETEDEDEDDAADEGVAAVPDQPTPELNTAPAAEETSMADQVTAAPGGATKITAVEATAAERQRAKGIMALCQEWSMADKAEGWIDAGLSVDQVSAEILKVKAQSDGQPFRTPPPKQLLDWTAEDQLKFSVVRAINAAADGDWSDAKFEREVMLETQKSLGYESRGGRKLRGNSVIIPTGLRALPDPYHAAAARTARQFDRSYEDPRRPGATLTAGGATSGAELVFTEAGSFIDMLRNRMVTTRMGATFLPGLQGNVDFPKQTAAGTFTWRAENPGTNVALSDLVTGSVELRPNDGTSRTSFSRRLLAQSVINTEQLVRSDLAAISAIGLDLAALHGAGGNEPTGIYNQSGVNAVAFNGVITYAKVVDMETEIAADNADIGRMGYVTTPRVRGVAKKTEVFATTNGMPLWTGTVLEGEMNGYRALASNQLSSTLGSGAEHGIIFGAWEHLLIGEWGAMELIVDPYTLAGQGLIVITTFLIADAAVRYPEAFCIGTNLQLS